MRKTWKYLLNGALVLIAVFLVLCISQSHKVSYNSVIYKVELSEFGVGLYEEGIEKYRVVNYYLSSHDEKEILKIYDVNYGKYVFVIIESDNLIEIDSTLETFKGFKLIDAEKFRKGFCSNFSIYM